MARLGSGLGEILAAGQWRSLAFQRYCNAEDNIDPNEVLQLTLDREAADMDKEDGECCDNKATMGGGSNGDDGE